MQFPASFVPTAREVGLLPLMTEWLLVVGMFSFAGAAVFFLVTRNSVAPWHRNSAALSVVICLVAAVSYGFLRYYYHDMLHQLVFEHDPLGKRRVVHDSFFALGQYRYMDWAVTTPLLLLKMVLTLKVKPREVAGWVALLLGADLFMIVAGAVGDQQFGADGALLAGRHLVWGTLSTAGYAVVVYVLFARLGRRYGGMADDESGWAFRLMALSTVTFWGVYPLGYLVPALWPGADLNWVHLAFTGADVVNKVGVGVVAFLAGSAELEKRVPPEAVQHGRVVG